MTKILEDLAAGRIDSAEAARRIDALPAADKATGTDDSPASADETETTEQTGSTDAWAASTDRPQQATHVRESVRDSGAEKSKETMRRPQGSGGVEKLSVRAVGRRVRIVGEPSVATVSADGPHVLRRNGSVLEISSDGEFGASIDGFQLLRSTRSLDDFRSLGLGKELLLRVNPQLLVDIEVTAGSLSTEAVPRLGSVRVTAGGAKLVDVTEISDALIQAGQATVKAAIGAGRSRIRVESGSLSLQLADSSNVTVATESQLGKVSWGGAHAGFAGDEVVMGSGAGRLDIEVVMGHASVKAGTAAASPTGAA
ncbi:hypothetical protein FOE78_20185 [Microlunatus elymi]|uniref:Adhesin n=2 Tax=Microlunatus elymi TaxID=2596828 RepID=A0A516Q6B9_9ACTN|nr:hypothetical protein FOE78_20185 [Microlunatus elymi]